MDCELCKSPVEGPVRIEERSGLCVGCIPKVADSWRTLKEQNRRLEESLLSSQDECKNHVETMEHMRRVVDAERLGRAASNKGVGYEENPYPEDDEEHIVWVSGWEHENVLNEFSRNMALLRWVTESLEVIRDISQEEEVRLKLGTVIDKTIGAISG